MQVEELTKKIHDEYPKCWERFIDYSNDIFYFQNNDKKLYYCNEYMEWYLIPFSMLYGLLEDFFWKHKEYLIDYINVGMRGYMGRITKNVYDRIKEQAILKASELLEGKLNDKNM
jgi:hypothetical protein